MIAGDGGTQRWKPEFVSRSRNNNLSVTSNTIGDSTLALVIVLGLVATSLALFVGPSISIAIFLVLVGYVAGKMDKRGIFAGAVLAVAVNWSVVTSVEIIPSAGAFQAAIVCASIGLALASRVSLVGGARSIIVYRGAVLALVLLTFLTISSPNSFGSREDPSTVKLLWISLLICALLVTFWRQVSWHTYAAIQVFLGIAVVAFYGYLEEMGRNEIWNSRVVALAAIAILSLPRIPLILRVALGIPLSILTFSLGKEGPELALVAGVVVYVLYTASSSTKYRHFRLPVIFGAGVAAAILVFLFAQLFSGVDETGTASIRQYLVQTSFEVFAESPLSGGLVTSPPVPGLYFTYPHNVVAEVLISWGLVGLAAWGVAVVASVVGGIRSGTAPLVVAALIMALTSGDFAGNPEYWFLGAASLIAIAPRTSRAHRANSPNRLPPSGVVKQVTL